MSMKVHKTAAAFAGEQNHAKKNATTSPEVTLVAGRCHVHHRRAQGVRTPNPPKLCRQNYTPLQRRKECTSQTYEPSPGYAAQQQSPATWQATKSGGEGSGGKNAARKGRKEKRDQRLARRGKLERG